MKVLILILLLVTGFASTAEAADCYYDGNTYTPGTRVGPLVCQADGTWKEE